MTRLMFVGYHRIIESVLTLQFDRFLLPVPERTIIYLGPIPEDDQFYGIDLLELYQSFGIKTDQFRVVQDPPVNDNLNFRKHGNWIGQQLLKLMAIDACLDDEILLQDCDTFAIQPYQYFKQHEPITFVLQAETHSPEYYEYITKFLDIPRQNHDSFVTEFLPIKKINWLSLRARIEELHQKPWLQAMLDIFGQDHKPGQSLWFAEFEMLGNWFLYKNPDMKMIHQKRLNFDSSSLNAYRLTGKMQRQMPFSHYNCFCIKLYDKPNQLTLAEIPQIADYINCNIHTG